MIKQQLRLVAKIIIGVFALLFTGALVLAASDKLNAPIALHDASSLLLRPRIYWVVFSGRVPPGPAVRGTYLISSLDPYPTIFNSVCASTNEEATRLIINATANKRWSSGEVINGVIIGQRENEKIFEFDVDYFPDRWWDADQIRVHKCQYLTSKHVDLSRPLPEKVMFASFKGELKTEPVMELFEYLKGELVPRTQVVLGQQFEDRKDKYLLRVVAFNHYGGGCGSLGNISVLQYTFVLDKQSMDIEYSYEQHQKFWDLRWWVGGPC